MKILGENMLLRNELQKYGVVTGFNVGQVEIDYLQHLFLLLFSKKSSTNLIFKGGTALQKIYGLHRFSIDLDFTQKGTDESKEMIRMAIDKEANMPLGINYKIGKVGELGKIGEFDIITGSFLLHYSKSKNELRNMLKDIYINLKEGGIFLGINNNPEHPLCSDEKYGNLIKSTLPLNLTSPLDSGSH